MQAPTPDDSLDPHRFIVENAAQTAYWADLAREAASIGDDALLEYATRKAAAYARAFIGTVRDLILADKGADR